MSLISLIPFEYYPYIYFIFSFAQAVFVVRALNWASNKEVKEIGLFFQFVVCLVFAPIVSGLILIGVLYYFCIWLLTYKNT